MEASSIFVAAIVTVPSTIAALAAWVNAKATRHQTNGLLHEPLERIEQKIDDLLDWQVDHVRRLH